MDALGICSNQLPVLVMQDPRERPGADDQTVVYIRYGIFFILGAFLWGFDGGVGMVVIYLFWRILFS